MQPIFMPPVYDIEESRRKNPMLKPFNEWKGLDYKGRSYESRLN